MFRVKVETFRILLGYLPTIHWNQYYYTKPNLLIIFIK